MSYIKKLQISGIRSYDPDYYQTISFQKPLTLIQGSNGSGKTTIIECLKTLTTSSFPPGTDQGKSFLTDPDLKGQKSVQGKLKILFKAINDEEILVQRNYQVTKGDGLKCQNKENFLMLYEKNKDGVQEQKKKVDFKQKEIEKTMSELLGVKQAVLQNVIFCHQEENLWCFQSNSVLKQIFDDIFETDQYTKIQEQFSAKYKELQKDEKESETKLKSLGEQYKNEIKEREKLHKDVDQLLLKGKTLEELKKEIKSEDIYEPEEEELSQEILETIQDQIKKFKNRENVGFIVQKLQKQKENLAQKTGKIQQEILEKEKIIKENRKILESQNQSKLESINLLQIKNEKEIILKNLEQNKIQQNYYSSRQKTINGQMEINLLKSQLAKIISTVQKEENFKLGNEQIKQNIQQLEAFLKNILEEEKNVWEKIKNKRNQEFNSFQEKIRKMENSQIQMQNQNLENKKQQEKLESKKKEKQNLKNQKLLAIQNIQNKQKNLQNYEKLESERQTTLLQIKLVKQQEEQNQEKSNGLLNLMMESSKIIDKKNYLEIKQKCSDIQKTIKEIDLKIEQLISENPKDYYHEIIDKILDIKQQKNFEKFQQEIKMVKSQEILNQFNKNCIYPLDYQKSNLNSQKQNFNEKRKQIVKQINENKNQIQSKGIKSFNNLTSQQDLEEIKKQITNLKKNLVVQTLKLEMNLTQTDKCLVCNSCVNVYEKETEIYIKMSEIEKEIFQLKEQKKLILTNKDLLENNEKLQTEYQNITEKEQENETKIQNIEQQYILVKTNETKLTKKIEIVSAILNQINLIQKHNEEIFKLNREIKLYQSTYPEFSSIQIDFSKTSSIQEISLNQSMSTIEQTQTKNQLQEEQKKLKIEKDNLEKYLQKINDQMNDQQLDEIKRNKLLDEIKILENELQQLEGELILYEQDFVSLEQMSENEQQLLKSKRQFQQENEIWKKEQYDKELRFRDKERLIEELQNKNKEINKKRQQLQEQQQQQYGVKNIDLERVNDISSEELNRILKELDQNIQGDEILLEQLDKVKLIIDSKNFQQQKQIELGQMNEKKIGIEQAIQALQQQYEFLEIKMQEHIRLESEIKAKIEKFQQDINKNEKLLEKCAQEFQEQKIKFQVRKSIREDMKNYMETIENTLLEYHRDKMKEINLNIYETWKNIYSGQDIKKIEIKALEEGAAEAQNKPKNKKSYDYRLVMFTNDDKEMDMRGRCSMGQKILASIVIRLALAETFSLKCGVLALDEPTTNLDKVHIKKLADSLLRLIELKKQQNMKNFQLIIITHDQEFLQFMKNITQVYHKIIKNANGFSIIHQQDVPM